MAGLCSWYNDFTDQASVGFLLLLEWIVSSQIFDVKSGSAKGNSLVVGGVIGCNRAVTDQGDSLVRY